MGDDDRRVVPSDGGGVMGEISFRLKLILRLMRDRRVSPLLKLLPIGALLYLFVPDLAIGPFDDAAVVWLGSVLFVELCPPEVVREHSDDLRSVVDADWREAEEPPELKSGDPPQA
jgi:hypothetical protein